MNSTLNLHRPHNLVPSTSKASKSRRNSTEKYSFKPNLNKNSLKMASKLGKSIDRLTKAPKYSKNIKSIERMSRNQLHTNPSQKSPRVFPQSKTFSTHSCMKSPKSVNKEGDFKPAINPKSRQIDRQVSRSPLSRFDKLYLDKDHHNAKKNALKSLYDKEELLKDIEHCTFTPRINEQSYLGFNKSFEGQNDVFERNQQWQK